MNWEGGEAREWFVFIDDPREEGGEPRRRLVAEARRVRVERRFTFSEHTGG